MTIQSFAWRTAVLAILIAPAACKKGDAGAGAGVTAYGSSEEVGQTDKQPMSGPCPGASAIGRTDRQPTSGLSAGTLAGPETPSFLNDPWNGGPSRAQFFHWSEGSETFPVKWLLALKKDAKTRLFDPVSPGFGLHADARDETYNPYGLPIGMTIARQRPVGSARMDLFGFNCAACHVGELTAGGRTFGVIGAPNLFDARGFSAALVQSIAYTLKGDPAALPAFIQDLSALGDATVQEPTAVADLLRQFLASMTKLAAVPMTAPGPGRVDAFMTAHNLIFKDDSPAPMTSPVDYPRLWGLGQMGWFHWDGNTTSLFERNVGQAIGLGASPEINPGPGASAVQIGNIVTLEHLARQIETPQWPFGPIDPTARAKGEKIYVKECKTCHESGGATSACIVGTDPNRAQSFGMKMNDGRLFVDALAQRLKDITTAEGARENIPLEKLDGPNAGWQVTGKYVQRSLDGIWATAPYLHNGAVMSLADLLTWPRPSAFHVGSEVFDTSRVGYVDDGPFLFDTTAAGNGNEGHLYGTNLSADEKAALIDYLKTL